MFHPSMGVDFPMAEKPREGASLLPCSPGQEETSSHLMARELQENVYIYICICVCVRCVYNGHKNDVYIYRYDISMYIIPIYILHIHIYYIYIYM